MRGVQDTIVRLRSDSFGQIFDEIIQPSVQSPHSMENGDFLDFRVRQTVSWRGAPGPITSEYCVKIEILSSKFIIIDGDTAMFSNGVT